MDDRYEPDSLAAFDATRPANPFTNPDTSPKSTLSFLPDPMAARARAYVSEIPAAIEEGTRRLTYIPPRPDERTKKYGGIYAPDMDPAEGFNLIMAGPIAVEDALGKFAMKALPANIIENRLLQAGASKAELRARGISDWLAGKGTEPVDPLQLKRVLHESPFELKERIKRSVTGAPEWQEYHKLADRSNSGFITPQNAPGMMNYTPDLRPILPSSNSGRHPAGRTTARYCYKHQHRNRPL